MAFKFYEKSGFPGAVGVIDRTHIRMQSPGGDVDELYRNIKRCFSLNVQAVCNSEMLFMNIVARWRGYVHDSWIFRMSRLKQQFGMGDTRAFYFETMGMSTNHI